MSSYTKLTSYSRAFSALSYFYHFALEESFNKWNSFKDFYRDLDNQDPEFFRLFDEALESVSDYDTTKAMDTLGTAAVVALLGVSPSTFFDAVASQVGSISNLDIANSVVDAADTVKDVAKVAVTSYGLYLAVGAISLLGALLWKKS